MALKLLFPTNSVSRVERPGACFDISVYSNYLDEFIPWRVDKGAKIDQNAHVPEWIKSSDRYAKLCLKGLIQTDGCIYRDRGYPMVHFTNCIKDLSIDVSDMIHSFGYSPHLYTIPTPRRTKYVVRLSKKVDRFLKEMDISK